MIADFSQNIYTQQTINLFGVNTPALIGSQKVSVRLTLFVGELAKENLQ